MPTLILVWLVAINLWTMRCFRHDKHAAIQGRRRTPESELLGLALLGGSPGAFAARRLYRHKTRKEPFSTQLSVIAAIQIGAGVGLFFAW
ncbi:DUF1294 domain-containing protein [Microvirga sp. SRT01]|uniref:DUF1294 domain-containing protein n=1 Tax=Sphingomonas longa TaxID=2778730 RepID=A0ABS2DBZ1_9SPHN|nr:MULTISPECIES: DUF1294 domain-containing protein [Alphaproteobacteria]MBM6577559.1 DUF1294 domain-containing protein [Sphingomonas sp. BT552]MBR7710604.1 DUF1294 domain-containing protein [Microvirga sp. SRT01]